MHPSDHRQAFSVIADLEDRITALVAERDDLDRKVASLQQRRAMIEAERVALKTGVAAIGKSAADRHAPLRKAADRLAHRHPADVRLAGAGMSDGTSIE